jgi:hypothetical protein
MCSATLQDDLLVESFFNLVAIETPALFEHLSFEFLDEFEVFVPLKAGRTRDHDPSELMRGFLHCYYKDEVGIESSVVSAKDFVGGICPAINQIR